MTNEPEPNDHESDRNRINFSGGEIRSNAVRGTEVWNRDPLPKPPPPKIWTYELTLQMPVGTKMQAKSTSVDQLMHVKFQAEYLGYEFIKLERLND